MNPQSPPNSRSTPFRVGLGLVFFSLFLLAFAGCQESSELTTGNAPTPGPNFLAITPNAATVERVKQDLNSRSERGLLPRRLSTDNVTTLAVATVRFMMFSQLKQDSVPPDDELERDHQAVNHIFETQAGLTFDTYLKMVFSEDT